MSLLFNEEQFMLQQTVRDFVKLEVAPQVPNVLSNRRIPKDLYTRCGEMGFWLLGVPEERGGLGNGAVETTIVLEELAKELPSLAKLVAAGMESIEFLSRVPELADETVACMDGELTAALSYADSNNASVNDKGISASFDGEKWHISGMCRFTPVNAKLLIAVGKDDANASKAFLVRNGVEGTYIQPGYEHSGEFYSYGMPGCSSGEVKFKSCVPNITCSFDADYSELFNKRCLNIAAQALGCAKGFLEKTIEFCMIRTHDFKPLVTIKVVSQKLASLKCQIEAAHSMVYDCAFMYDEAKRSGSPDIMRAWAMKAECAKVFASEMASSVAKECVRLHGGMGYHSPALHHYVGDAMDYCLSAKANNYLWDNIAALMGVETQGV